MKADHGHVVRMMRLAGVWLAATLAADPASAGAAESAHVPAELLLRARRIAVLGDSITHDGRWLAGLVAWMESRGTEADVVDAALPSETVSGLSEPGHAGGRFPRPDLAERLERVLRIVRPDVVLACYGMNCGIYLPLDEGRFARFRDGIERLHAAVERSGAKIVHLTPPVYDGRKGIEHPAGDADYDAVLAAYSNWLVSRRADGWLVIDVHGPMLRLLAERRATDPAFTFCPDAVHPDDAGHWAICRAVLAGLGAGPIADAESPDRLAPFLPEVTTRLRLLRDATLAAAGHGRPGLPPGLPLTDAEATARALTESLRARRLWLLGEKRPSGEWVAPIAWQRPGTVDPGPAPDRPLPVPSDALVLFDGTNLDAWDNAAGWTVADGVATVGRGSIQTKRRFGDVHLHVEFRMPAPPSGTGQGRGNSGVFLMGNYEIQVLDSFEDGTDGPLTYPDGQCGALYKQRPPAVNACRPPGQWQTYDILFTRPRFDAGGALASPARVSVMHNGIAIHSDTVILGGTRWHEPPSYVAHDDALPILLQDHGDPVQYRSIWVREYASIAPELRERR